MDAPFMESCWWVFKQLWDMAKVYRAYQIMPISTALCTPLSQMEAKQNEKITEDPATLVAFPVVGQYVKIIDEKSGQCYILLESCLSLLYKDLKKAKYKVLSKVSVIGADYVEADEGTSLVHQAPASGQEDYDAAVAAGFISPDRLVPCPVDNKGQFTSDVPDYAGQHVKVAEKDILRDLRKTGRFLVDSMVTDSDKFCWRSDTQLIRVKEVVIKVLLPLWNSYRFFHEQAVPFETNTDAAFVASTFSAADNITNVMDRWILADCQSMLRFIDQAMLGYRLYTVVPRLLRVIDNLTNWYIRFNRKRLKGSAGLGVGDTRQALSTLCQVLLTLVRALAPFTPFVTEHIYGLLKPYLGDQLSSFANLRSVHFLPYPIVRESLFGEITNRKVSSM
ncbi:hypothetical protein Daus18300_006557 [Diaporthe australafricana]|uniref:Methionyl/Valyl/Leucyl/Isoleucyl-tRNA synthetase anticodon-binding domain-containing protein n=1 Tax=Diaporthe australafricana TaxID=127596 RepID=A0ABR3WU47_9PEZI